MTLTLSGWLEQHAGLPRSEREMLLCRRLGLDRAVLISHPDRELSPASQAQLAEDARRLHNGEPLAYLLGDWSFWDFDLTVTKDVLIPRPETETLVEAALARLQPGDRVLDLGTGSGAIAIALARSAAVSVLAIDSSAEALAVAARNAERAEVAVSFQQSDWFSDIAGTFEMIVANPPYIAREDPHLSRLRFEPSGALVSGPEGLDDLSHIISRAPAHLTAAGWLLVEHGYDQAEPVRALFAGAGFRAVSLLRDLGGQPRVTLGRMPRPAPE